MALVEFGRGQGFRGEGSGLAPVWWAWLVGFGTQWLLELDHLRQSTSLYQPRRGDERSRDQMNDGGGRGVGCVGWAHREKNEELGEKKFCARRA